MRAPCPGCGRLVQVRPYRGGDGSAVRVSRHKAEPDHAVSCSGSYSQLNLAEVRDDVRSSPVEGIHDV